MAEGAFQIGYFLMVEMIEENRLIDGNPFINWKNGKENHFGLNPKSMVGDYCKKDDKGK